ncbi:DNA-directed RNA polymerase subunit beta [Desulfococcaceae bacterium HSG9]|nr:DNA-directed RNA polymerase subunit beta [Desulfococcaceae bacterium HSG9]
MSAKPVAVRRIRKNFGKIKKITDIPDLIGVQRESYNRFLQKDTEPEQRDEIGLQTVFHSVFPIKDFTGCASLEFVSYRFAESKNDVDECIHSGITYEIPIRITVRLVVYDVDKETGVSSIRDIKEQEIFFGALPLMTSRGTFVINGTERVVVSQLHRSSGVFFAHDKGKSHSSGKVIYSARIIPVRGSWVDMEIDHKAIVNIRIDRRRKFPITLLFKTFGYTVEDILEFFYGRAETYILDAKTSESAISLKIGFFMLPTEMQELSGKLPEEIVSGLANLVKREYHREAFYQALDMEIGYDNRIKYQELICLHAFHFDASLMKNRRAPVDIVNPDTDKLVIKRGKPFTRRVIDNLKAAAIDRIPIPAEDFFNENNAFVAARTVITPLTQQIIIRPNEFLTESLYTELLEEGVTTIDLIDVTPSKKSISIHRTLMLDKVDGREEAMLELYRRLRPGNPATADVAQDFVDNMFFKPSYYDLSIVGRHKINSRLGIDTPNNVKTLRKEDILLTTKKMIELRETQGVVDDIDHLGNRRVRSVGELLENQYRIGLVRMERAIKERMSLQEVDALMPDDLVNPKPVTSVVKEFFGTSQLSQFMDQTNALSETTHKRRLSALGPGGLTRERAGFEVRDVHPSHYGRICPIETPEGPNIGLIVSLSTYANVNQYGFIETPYRVVENGAVTTQVKFLTAFDEKQIPIAQANAPLNDRGRYVNPMVTSRVEGELMMTSSENIELMDVSPNQLVSVSASLIPFLENDDANRALMGSNMMRQAVPLLTPSAPLVGTGIENVVAKDSGVTTVAKADGVVTDVDASRIIIRYDSLENDISPVYSLSKFIRTNQNTCFNHRPIVKKGQRVKAGQIIADGPATDQGELALGKNVIVAFMPWGGYNFEDSILVSERLHREGVYTSIHIEEFEIIARDTKLGKEDITRDIPNVGEDALKYLDDSGVIVLGAEVRPGDILAGKITPKGETQLSPEEKLLRAIFGEKAGDVKDTSLRVPPGVQGIVIDAKVFSRRGVEKDERTRLIEDREIEILEKKREDERSIVDVMARKALAKLLAGQTSAANLKLNRKVLIAKGAVIDSSFWSEQSENLPLSIFERLVLTDEKCTERVDTLLQKYKQEIKRCNDAFYKSVARFEKGDDLPPGVIKMVKVYVAMKRKLSVGDKMAGRHGNKGVVSRILPQEDLPYFKDGTTVDMVLNPLGVPSRMNVGQVLEIHLGYAARELGLQVNKLLEERQLTDLRDKMKRIFSNSVAKTMEKVNVQTDKEIVPMLDQSSELSELDDAELEALAGYYREGVHIATPVFDGAKEDEIKALLKEAGLSQTAQATLYDGRTGEKFKGKITVGTMYMLKLHHLVDDKIHARSIGPYSLVTQQPLGGKAQFGGQRLGEMEVWAMEAYGAASTLQEFLTVKADDMAGRTRMYEKIVKGHNTLEPGIPESFRVLTKELQSLGIEVTLNEKRR